MLVQQLRTKVTQVQNINEDKIELLHNKYHDIYGIWPANMKELVIWITDDLASALHAPSVDQDIEDWEHILNTVVGPTSITTDELCFVLDKMYFSFKG